MPTGLKRYQQAQQLHFITFNCFQHAPFLATAEARELVEHTLERVRRWYGFYVTAYVVMPDHVHALMSEPERCRLSLAIQMWKQIVSRKLRGPERLTPFWQRRYYDFNVWSETKLYEKMNYIHQNPVRRGLVERAQDWAWSSCRHIATGEASRVEVESLWTARERERMGIVWRIHRQEQ